MILSDNEESMKFLTAKLLLKKKRYSRSCNSQREEFEEKQRNVGREKLREKGLRVWVCQGLPAAS